jgi:hypothetical protein
MIQLQKIGLYRAETADHYAPRLRTRATDGDLVQPEVPLQGGALLKDPLPPFQDDVTDRTASAWTDLVPEPITWSKQGLWKRFFSLGIAKPVIEGSVASGSSHIVVYNPVEILLFTVDPRVIHRYQLVPFRTHRGLRKAAVVPLADKQSVAVRQGVAFGVDWMGNNLYRLYFPDGLPAGEYGLLRVDGIVRRDTSEVRTFRVFE